MTDRGWSGFLFLFLLPISLAISTLHNVCRSKVSESRYGGGISRETCWNLTSHRTVAIVGSLPKDGPVKPDTTQQLEVAAGCLNLLWRICTDACMRSSTDLSNPRQPLQPTAKVLLALQAVRRATRVGSRFLLTMNGCVAQSYHW